MKCSLCDKDIVEAYNPFCSKRCADVDLHRWMSGVYAVPTEERGNIPTGEDDSDYQY